MQTFLQPNILENEKLFKSLDFQVFSQSRQADKQTSRQADKQTSRQADKQTSRQADKQTSRQADKQTSRQADKQTSRQASIRNKNFYVKVLKYMHEQISV
ncbi:hypothetical protein HCQ94_05350 [Actinomyces sp. zg-332]|uniref:hypothetical protein n=1 Tax=Actinomyces sp. zg-332 TaxID=2708340 RepID=UPI0018C1EEEE|nr:hypothetical protein [Actinomyces sp. zg-332]QPK93996.1 hypothetical protein HCQ94_05350 [Actinomyces sp. zg-332]